MFNIKNLSVKYPDGHIALENIDLSLAPGEKIALLGANGAGKSTLLLTMSGIVPPYQGSISLDGMIMDKKNLEHFRKKTGLVFQNPDDQIFMTSVYEDIAFGPKNYGYTAKETEIRVKEVMADLDISHLAERLPSKLSGGEKRLVAIAGVLVLAPELILFDEPSSFLDPRAKRNLLSLLKELPMTCLIATHDISFAGACCNRAVILKEGRIAADEHSMDILDDDRFLLSCGL